MHFNKIATATQVDVIQADVSTRLDVIPLNGEDLCLDDV